MKDNEKKIMVVTLAHAVYFHYGAFLQTFALQTRLTPFVNLLDFVPNYTYRVKQKKRQKYPLGWRLLAMWRSLRFRYSSFNEILRLKKTPHYGTVKSVLTSHSLDFSAYIVGSDQVWNSDFIDECQDVYFLNFGHPSAKRIAYAASLGMRRWPKDFEKMVLPMLHRFDAISVREESSVPYLTSLGLKNVVCVCDPTILYKGDFYREQFNVVDFHNDDYAFIYKLREVLPSGVVSYLHGFKLVSVELEKKKTLVSIAQWLANIDHAKFIITDSFHCIVFCILFHKPFAVIPNRANGKGMDERFATLLGKTDLEYRVLSCEESKEQVLSILNRPIDWDHVDAILEEWRTYSGNWLKQALEK